MKDVHSGMREREIVSKRLRYGLFLSISFAL